MLCNFVWFLRNFENKCSKFIDKIDWILDIGYEKQRNASKSGSRKVSKSFWRKKTHCCEYSRKRFKILSEDEKQKFVEYRRNYFIIKAKNIKFQFFSYKSRWKWHTTW